MGSELTLVAALLIGFVGSTHCLGMCGGIAGALGGAAPKGSGLTAASYAMAYNTGRITSYALFGAVVGFLGAVAGSGLDTQTWLGVLRGATGLVMIAIGLYLLVNWSGLRRIEALGAGLWRRISPLARRLMPPRNQLQAFAVGGLWGWLPCGLVYTMLLTAAVSGSAINGASVMIAFGMGTLPAMAGVTAVGNLLRRHLFKLRRAGGALILAFGVWTLATPLWHAFHSPHGM